MKFRRSVTRFIITALTVGLVIYSLGVAFMVKNRLNAGLDNYFETEVEDQAGVFTDEFNFALSSAKSSAAFIQHSYEEVYEDFGFDRTLMNSFAEGAKNYYNAKNIVFFNSFGMQVSSSQFGSARKDENVTAALAGREVVKFEKEDDLVYALVVLPLKSDGRVFGVVEIKTPVTDDELVQTIKQYTNCDASILIENKVILSTIENRAGATVDDELVSNKPVLLKNMINGVKYISYYFPFTDENGNFIATLYIGKKLDIETNVTRAIFTPLIAVFVISTLVFLIFFLCIIHSKVTTPIRNVRKAVANLSSGDADLTMRLDTASGDEFAQLSGEVNKFIEMLQKIIAELNVSQSSLNEVSSELGDNAADSASATAQILANIESVRKQSQNQSEAVQNTSNVLSMSSEAVDTLNQLISQQSDSVSQSSAAIEEMLGNISAVSNSVRKMSNSFEELGSTVNEGKSKLGNVNDKVNEIAEQSKMLMQANQVISQIAAETNLLAMNAAIEAAHAGETGKGFSVVAEEIRKLAENSSLQSKNISSELKEISGSIQAVVSLSGDSKVAFEAIVNRLGSTDMIIREINNAMEEQQIASKQIFESLGEIKNQSSEVSAKAQDMNHGISEVAKDMSTVSQISTTILGSMDEMTTGMQQIGEVTQNVSSLAGQTKNNIGDMSNKLNQFKV